MVVSPCLCIVNSRMCTHLHPCNSCAQSTGLPSWHTQVAFNYVLEFGITSRTPPTLFNVTLGMVGSQGMVTERGQLS